MSETIGHKFMENDVEVRVGLQVITKDGGTRRATIGDCIDAIMDMCNGPSNYVGPAVAEAFTRDHRTLQQSFVKNVIMPILEQLYQDGETGYFDDRNASSVAFATKVLNNNESYFPTI